MKITTVFKYICFLTSTSLMINVKFGLMFVKYVDGLLKKITLEA